MAKAYVPVYGRQDKKAASEAYANGLDVRVEAVIPNNVTHVVKDQNRQTIKAGKYPTLTRGIDTQFAAFFAKCPPGLVNSSRIAFQYYVEKA